jgi:carbon-monoxide dehydrogenase medium subunit
VVALARPRTLEEAIDLLDRELEARPLGGGTAIQILRRQGLLNPSLLVDLAAIPELQGVHQEDGALRIGAMVTHRQVERSSDVRNLAPLLAETYKHVGNVRVRHTATVGGNLAHGDYRLDPPAALLALHASVRIAGKNGVRDLPMDAFFVDLLETALGHAELLVDVRVPLSAARRSTAFEKFSSLAANDWPCVGVAAALDWAVDGELQAARLGVTAMAPTPLLFELPGAASEDDLAQVAVDAVLAQVDPIPDVRGSAAYKRRACAAVVRDAIARAWRAEREPAGREGEPAGREREPARDT